MARCAFTNCGRRPSSTKLRGKIILSARHQTHVPFLDEGHGAVAVPFNLEEPVGLSKAMGVEVASIGWITVGMGFCSAPARTFIAEGAEFAEDFLALDLDAAPLDARPGRFMQDRRALRLK